MGELRDYATLAPSNQATPPAGFPIRTEGGNYGGVVRELMARCKRFILDLGGASTATGSGGAYVVATAQAMVLEEGTVISFWTNHSNPNDGPTVNVGGTGPRPLTYADGSTIPKNALSSRQIVDARWDNTNGRWCSILTPASQFAGTVTGSQISLTGEQTGSVAIKSSTGWIAAAAGSASQYFKGGTSPGFATFPNDLPGMVLLACSVSAGVTITNRSGLKHTASVSKLSTGNYRLIVSPALPTNYVLSLTVAASPFRYATPSSALTSTQIEFTYCRTVDPSIEEDISGSERVDVMVI